MINMISPELSECISVNTVDHKKPCTIIHVKAKREFHKTPPTRNCVTK